MQYSMENTPTKTSMADSFATHLPRTPRLKRYKKLLHGKLKCMQKCLRQVSWLSGRCELHQPSQINPVALDGMQITL